MIRLYSADPQTSIEFYPKAVSETFTFSDMVYLSGDGYVTKAVDGASFVPLGLISATRVPVLVPGPDAIFECDVTTGTAAATDVGEWIDIDDHNSVDVAASTYDLFFVTKVISGTVVLAKMAKKSGVAI